MIKGICDGNLGADPRESETSSGTKIANFNVASNDRGETTWIRVAVFGKAAEACLAHLSKGSRVCCYGNIKLNEWEKDGETRTNLEMRADDVQFLGGRKRDDEDIPL